MDLKKTVLPCKVAECATFRTQLTPIIRNESDVSWGTDVKLRVIGTYSLAALLLALGGWGSSLVKAGNATCREARAVITDAEGQIAEIANVLTAEAPSGNLPDQYYAEFNHHKVMITKSLADYRAAGCDLEALELRQVSFPALPHVG